MSFWIKRLHIYSGLLNVTILTVFGLVGLAASLLPPPRERDTPAARVEERPYPVPGDLDDRQLADRIQRDLALPLTGPAPRWALGRNRDGNLRFRLFTPTRRYEITVLEADDRLRIRTQPFDAWQVLFHLHELVPARAQPDLRLQAWAWYVEFSIWALLFMVLSGLYMWLDTRPRHRLAWVAFAAGTLLCVAVYAGVR